MDSINTENNFSARPPLSNDFHSTASLQHLQQKLINNGAMQHYESVGSWFENQLKTSGSSQGGIPDWDHMTVADLEGMSPEQQKALFKNMGTYERKKLAALMKEMPVKERCALLDNMTLYEMSATLAEMDPTTRDETSKHLTEAEKRGLVKFQIMQDNYNEIVKRDKQLSKALDDLKQVYKGDKPS
ncbi:MAG: hypothetical protein C5B47_00885 [Verrucomicrobia bacterium]|nr:MAG: hypothetical protein C5B47_00885 [Verrucomicrobiota bacterium]